MTTMHIVISNRLLARGSWIDVGVTRSDGGGGAMLAAPLRGRSRHTRPITWTPRPARRSS
jgi:hypothetical protein